MLSKAKKVAIFVDGEFIPSFSGAADRFHYLSRALQKFTDTEVVIVLCDRGWSDIGEIANEEFRTYLIYPSLFNNVAFLSEILKNEGVDLVQFANLELAIKVGIPLAENLGVHLVFEAHYGDIEFAKAIGASQEILKKISKIQNKFGKYFDKVIALSGDDAELAKNLRIPKRNIAIIPSGVNPEDFPVNCFNGLSKRIVFLGNLFFGANLVAARKIKRTIFGTLKRKGYEFCIIGDIAPGEKKKLGEKNFIITGKQQNLGVAFKGTTIALAPITNGAGMRIKILNYLNAGIPVITTHEGARGFPKKNLLIIEDDIKKYPAIIERMVGERVGLKSFSVRGRRFVQERMSWKFMAVATAREYKAILRKPVIPKAHAVHEAAMYSFKDPAWIREVITKKRFKRNTPFVKEGKYSILGGIKNRLVVALEGLPCAGKSTFMNTLKENGTDFLCMPELYIKVRKGVSNISTRKRYAVAEIIKKRNADLSGKSKILMDRSFLSTLAFSYAKSKTFSDNADYSYSKKFLKENWKKILLPNFVIVFDITPEESLKRRKRAVRDDILAVWRNRTFLRHLRDFYSSPDIEEIIGKKSVVFIDAMGMDESETYKSAFKNLQKF